MNDLEILSNGLSDQLDPMNPMELEMVYGGFDYNTVVKCDKGYKSGGTVVCKCGYNIVTPAKP